MLAARDDDDDESNILNTYFILVINIVLAKNIESVVSSGTT